MAKVILRWRLKNKIDIIPDKITDNEVANTLITVSHSYITNPTAIPPTP